MMVAYMSGPPRTVRYEGLYPSQIRERFEQDAADAAADDWYPTSESWQSGVLLVVYEHDPARAHRAAMTPPPSGPRDPGPGPSPHQPDHRVSRPMPPWQRAAVGLGVAVVLVVTASLTLFGFGNWDRPGTAPGNPVRQATPAPGGLGPRTDAIAFLESHGFRGAVSPVGDGQEHWLGQGVEGSLVELLGPAGGLLRATLTVFPVQDVGVGEIAQPTDVLRFLDRFAPGSDAWATAHTDDAVAARGVPVRQRFGDRILAVSALDGEDASVFTYAVTQAEAPPRSRRTPRPAAAVRTFGDGTWQVGTEVRPGPTGWSRTAPAPGCAWARRGRPPGHGQRGRLGPRLVSVGKRDVAIARAAVVAGRPTCHGSPTSARPSGTARSWSARTWRPELRLGRHRRLHVGAALGVRWHGRPGHRERGRSGAPGGDHPRLGQGVRFERLRQLGPALTGGLRPTGRSPRCDPAYTRWMAARPWNDPQLTGSDRVPMHSVPHLDRLDLDGTWDFQLLPHPEAPLADAWRDITVPGAWTMQDTGDLPHYTNVQMPFPELPPEVPHANPTGVYRRTFRIPAAWKGRRVVLHVGAAESWWS